MPRSSPVSLERLLNGLPGVRASRVARGEEGVTGIHLLVNGKPGATRIDAQTVVMTALGQHLDRDAIQITTVSDSAVWDMEGRWRLISMGSSRRFEQLGIHVRLREMERVLEGESEGKAGDEMEVAARAVLAALGQAVQGAYTFQLVDLRAVDLVPGEAVVAAVVLGDHGGERTLAGIAAADAGRREGAARAVLDAVNRAFR